MHFLSPAAPGAGSFSNDSRNFTMACAVLFIMAFTSAFTAEVSIVGMLSLDNWTEHVLECFSFL